MDSEHPIMHVADVGAVGIVAGVLLQWLPAISALLSIVWLSLRIVESRIAQKAFRWMGWKWLILDTETKDENRQENLR